MNGSSNSGRTASEAVPYCADSSRAATSQTTSRPAIRLYGTASLAVRPLLLEPFMRRMLSLECPAVIDGRTGARRWLADPEADGLRKVDFYQYGFDHLGPICYDPVYDLAGAAADPPGAGFEARLRAAYQRSSGQLVDAER